MGFIKSIFKCFKCFILYFLLWNYSESLVAFILKLFYLLIFVNIIINYNFTYCK